MRLEEALRIGDSARRPHYASGGWVVCSQGADWMVCDPDMNFIRRLVGDEIDKSLRGLRDDWGPYPPVGKYVIFIRHVT